MSALVERVRHGARGSFGRSTPSEPPDEVLLAGFAASEPDAASAFVRRFQQRVFGVALNVVGEAGAAEDVAQEAFVRAWRRADAFDVARGSVTAWLLTITRNLSIDALRVRRPDAVAPGELVEMVSSASGEDPARVTVARDDIGRVHAALCDLPDEQRRAVLLARVWGCSASDIAAREGIPVGTAKTRIRAGLARLRPALTAGEWCPATRS